MSGADPRLAQAVALLNSGKAPEAAAALRRLAATRPKDAGVARALAAALVAIGEHEQAAFHASRAIAALPTDAHAWQTLVAALLAQGRMDDAAEAAARSTRAIPDNPDLLAGHAEALRAAGRYRDCLRIANDARVAHPGNLALAAAAASALGDIGRTRECARELASLAASHPDDPAIASLRCASAAYAAGASPAQALEPFVAYGALLERLAPPRPTRYAQSREPERRLRIAFLSPDLRAHPVATFMEAPLRTLDRAAFEVVVYSTSHAEDHVSRRLAALPLEWTNVASLDANALARRIFADRIDILVELSGHTTGNRLPALHVRPAPVQATYLGFPSTTGVRAIDWRIVDGITDPPGAANAWSIERLARVEAPFLCYRPPLDADAPSVTPRPEHGGAVVFGSCNSISKVTESVVALWARLLHAVPGSRLLLKHLALSHQQGRDLLAERFAAEGVGADRLDLRGHSPYRQLLDTYNEIDVALDPFPFNGATTTCDALFMGCPVVTLAGDRSAARVGMSILGALSLGELIANDEADFIAIARGLGHDRARFDALRAHLRGRLVESRLCDAPAFGARFGDCLRDMWRQYCAHNG